MKAAYWIISAAITVAGIGLMAEGHRQMGRTVKAEQASGAEAVRTEHFASAKNLSVDLGSSDVRIAAAKDAEDITVSVTNPQDNLIIECSDDTLIVKQKAEFQLFNFDISKKRMQTTITIPEGMQLEDAAIDIGSGNLSEMRGLSLRTLDAELGSGSASIQVLEVAENCSLRAGSGSMSAEQCSIGGELYLHAGSGNMAVKDCDIRGALTTDCGSGDLEIRSTKAAEEMHADFGSGNLIGDNLEIGGAAFWDFGSGNAHVTGFRPADGLEVDLGSGKVELTLTGKEEDYGYDTTDISGDVIIDGRKLKEIEDIREGKPTICVRGGSGHVTIGFAE